MGSKLTILLASRSNKNVDLKKLIVDLVWTKMLFNTPFFHEHLKGYYCLLSCSIQTDKRAYGEQGVIEVCRINVSCDVMIMILFLPKL